MVHVFTSLVSSSLIVFVWISVVKHFQRPRRYKNCPCIMVLLYVFLMVAVVHCNAQTNTSLVLMGTESTQIFAITADDVVFVSSLPHSPENQIRGCSMCGYATHKASMFTCQMAAYELSSTQGKLNMDKLPRMNTNRRSGPLTFILDDRLYEAGGYGLTKTSDGESTYTSLNDVESLSLTSGRKWKAWKAEVDLPFPIQNTERSAAVVAGRVYQAGGTTFKRTSPNSSSGTYTMLNSLISWQLGDLEWTMLEPMAVARQDHCVVSTSNFLYAIGGSNGMTLSSVEKYDIETNTWSAVKALPRAMSYMACATYDNVIYVFHENNIYMYDMTTDEWRTSEAKSLERVRGAAAGIIM